LSICDETDGDIEIYLMDSYWQSGYMGFPLTPKLAVELDPFPIRGVENMQNKKLAFPLSSDKNVL
jgi:hypothetical protein